MKRILFVDDDPLVLDGLRRVFHPHTTEWQTSFADSGPQALEAMARCPFDAIITDLRMPGMDGNELLAEVRERHPQTVRIILSGQADRELTLKSTRNAHQYLSKPCDAATLKATIARASALRDVLHEPSLQALVGRARSLPSVPALYQDLMREFESPESSVNNLAGIIARDTAMTTKILQLANSAFFGASCRILNPKDAVLYLGFDTIKALTLTVKVFARFSSAGSCFSVDALARHSVVTAAIARKIAKAVGLSVGEMEDSFLAGLLHDVGKLVLVDALPGKYAEVLRLAEAEGTSVLEAERKVFGTTHQEVGAYLLWLWGLPDPAVEAVAYHHCPNRCPGARVSPLTAVHIADAVSHCRTENGTTPGQTPDQEYLDGLHVTRAAWQTFAEELAREETVQ